MFWGPQWQAPMFSMSPVTLSHRPLGALSESSPHNHTSSVRPTLASLMGPSQGLFLGRQESEAEAVFAGLGSRRLRYGKMCDLPLPVGARALWPWVLGAVPRAPLLPFPRSEQRAQRQASHNHHSKDPAPHTLQGSFGARRKESVH